jgi:hypothetical protein
MVSGRVRYAIVVLSITALLTPSILIAAPPVVVYRGDGRPPDVIFASGFQPGGTRANPLYHISGDSCFGGLPTERRSGWISVSRSRTTAQHYARYVYEIAAQAGGNEQMFDLTESLGHIATQGRNFGLVPLVQGAATEFQHLAARGEEIITRHVPANRIIRVHEYNRNALSGPSVLVRTTENPHYVPPQSSSIAMRFTDDILAGIRAERPPLYGSFLSRDNSSSGERFALCWASQTANAEQQVCTPEGTAVSPTTPPPPALPVASPPVGQWKCWSNRLVGPGNPAAAAMSVFVGS